MLSRPQIPTLTAEGQASARPKLGQFMFAAEANSACLSLGHVQVGLWAAPEAQPVH